MADDAVGHGQFAGRHTPLIGSGLQQHDACCGAALAHIILRTTDATAAAGGHVTPDTLACEVSAGGNRFNGDLFPVALEFFGHQLSETGMRALAHFGAGNADHAAVVGFDHHPGIHLGGGILRGSGRRAKRQAEPQCQTAAGGRGTDNKATAGDICNAIVDFVRGFASGFAGDFFGHGCSPQAWLADCSSATATTSSPVGPAPMWITEPTPLPVPAARCIAARTRW